MGCICAKHSSYVLDYAESPRGGGAGAGAGGGGGGGGGKASTQSQQSEQHNQHRQLRHIWSDVDKYADRERRRHGHGVGVGVGVGVGGGRSSASVQWRTDSSPFAKRRGGSPATATTTASTPGSRRLAMLQYQQQVPAHVAEPLAGQAQAEAVAAGWPAWLTAVAGEAIKGWIPRRADSFQKLYKIGQGTYSTVYKARDIENGKIVALKKVRFDSLEPESVRFMAREILILRRLDHPNIMKLEGLVTSGVSCSMYLVLEYMEHDLAGLMANPAVTLTEPQIKCYVQQLLRGLDHCHSRGVLHRDIKGSNLLIDNDGILKIGDFGLANFFHPGQRQLLTSRVVTLWYRPPELLLGSTDYGVAVDLWSTGCILAELLSGKPILPGKTEVEQLHKIFKLCGSPSDEYWKKCPRATIFKPQRPYRCCIGDAFKDFSPSALSLVQRLLAIEPAYRGNASGALNSDFFSTKPLPCDPSSLPKFPPSKEFDAKLRAEEARRQRARIKGSGYEAARRPSRLTRQEPASAHVEESVAQRQNLIASRAGKISTERSNMHLSGHITSLHDPSKALQQSQGNAGDAQSGGRISGKTHREADVASDPDKPDVLESSDSLRISGIYEHNSRVELLDKEQNWTEVHGKKILDRLETMHPTQSKDRCTHKEERVYSREQRKANHGVDRKIHFSGPLLYSSVSIDDMLQKHEHNMRVAVRKARRAKHVK